MPGYFIQGGDNTFRDGSGGESVYGGTFEPEEGNIKFKEPYLLAMAWNEEGHIGSQFFITTSKSSYLTQKEGVIIGRVVNNRELVERINDCGEEDGTPKDNVVISKSGVYWFAKPIFRDDPLEDPNFRPEY